MPLPGLVLALALLALPAMSSAASLVAQQPEPPAAAMARRPDVVFVTLDDCGLDFGCCGTPLDEYERNLEQLVGRLRAATGTLLWASTTPVSTGAQGRKSEDPARHNAAAARVVAAAGVPMIDLHSRAVQRLDLQRRRDVHFSAAGSEHLAEAVAAAVAVALGARR